MKKQRGGFFQILPLLGMLRGGGGINGAKRKRRKRHKN